MFELNDFRIWIKSASAKNQNHSSLQVFYLSLASFNVNGRTHSSQSTWPPLELCCCWAKLYHYEEVFPSSQWTQDFSLTLGCHYLLVLRPVCVLPLYQLIGLNPSHHLFLTVLFKSAKYKLCNKNGFSMH